MKYANLDIGNRPDVSFLITLYFEPSLRMLILICCFPCAVIPRHPQTADYSGARLELFPVTVSFLQLYAWVESVRFILASSGDCAGGSQYTKIRYLESVKPRESNLR